MIRSRFDVHGLDLEVECNDVRLNEAITEDLRFFRTARRPARGVVRLHVTALPHARAAAHPAPFDVYRNLGFDWRVENDDALVTSTGTSAITVIHHLGQRRIEAAVVPDASLLPDPAYHMCFTQPVGVCLKRRGLFFVHAACVARGDDGVLIVGSSHAGKSTLSLSAVRGGFRFLGDEQPLLKLEKRRVRALAFPRRVRLDRTGARRFRELGPVLRASRLERVVFSIEQIWPGSVLSSCIPRVVVFPTYDADRALEVRRVDRAEALARMLRDDHFVLYRDPAALRRASERHLVLFEQLVHQARCYTLRYGASDIRSAPKLFGDLLDA